MELGGIVEHLKGKSILVTGATGFLGKIFVEKVLRVQPDVKRLFLLVRAPAGQTATERVQDEIFSKELFKLLKDVHGDRFHSFISAKVSAIAGDIAHADLGIADARLRESLCKEANIIVNVAATTNFDERYDVALGVNTLGAKHVVDFAQRCTRLEVLVHVSTAFVAGLKDELILERPCHLEEAFKGGLFLDIDREIRLVEAQKEELRAKTSLEDIEKSSMVELGLMRARLFGWPNTYVFTKAMGEMLIMRLRGNLPVVIVRPTMVTSIYKDPLPGWIEGTRTIDSLIVGYARSKLPCMYGDLNIVMDVIPGDMVINAMIVAMVAHSFQQCEFIYQIGSSVRNPVKYSCLYNSCSKYFLENPRIGEKGEKVETRNIPIISSRFILLAYVMLRFRLLLEVLRFLNLSGLFSKQYNELKRKYKFVMRLMDLYEPYASFKGCFDDINSEGLRMRMNKSSSEEAKMFDFDPRHINWEDYFYSIHIPGVLKYSSNRRKNGLK